MRNLILFLSIAFLIACNNQPKHKSIDDSSLQLHKIFDNYYQDRLRYFPLEATAIADNRYNDKFPIDISESYRDTLRNFYKNYAAKIELINPAELKGQDLISLEVFKRDMQMQLEELTFPTHLMPINQFWSMHLSFPLLGSGSGNQPFKSTKDYDDFLMRIHAFTAYEDTAIANMRIGMSKGIVPARILMQKVVPQLKGLITEKPEESVFYTPIKNLPDNVNALDKERLTKAYVDAILYELVPCFKKMVAFIENEYIPACKPMAGISNIPGGKEYYSFLAKKWTTTKLSPDEIFNIGQSEVKRLRSEMEKVKEETGFKGDLKSFFHYIHTDKKFMPFKTDSEIIQAYRDIEIRMQPQLKKLFNLVPKAKFEVRQTEAFRAASASAEYNQAAPDGSRPGIFYVPILDAKKFNAVGMEDLFLHEAIPGHHYQTSIQQENLDLPDFRRFGWYGAYGEGWALYTESLGKELGLYTDPYQYFGSLSEEMHRAIRLVVDVGMHLKGWSREQAIQFSLDNEMESEADITAEIERYMAIPGQALAYKIGQMKIIELRKRAEEKFGVNFNIQKFHDEVLINGCLPLDVFEKHMQEWIALQQ
jgi:uncharacterized protein (DUF885 family)